MTSDFSRATRMPPRPQAATMVVAYSAVAAPRSERLRRRRMRRGLGRWTGVLRWDIGRPPGLGFLSRRCSGRRGIRRRSFRGVDNLLPQAPLGELEEGKQRVGDGGDDREQHEGGKEAEAERQS